MILTKNTPTDIINIAHGCTFLIGSMNEMSMSNISYPYAVDYEAGPSRKHSPINVTFFDK